MKTRSLLQLAGILLASTFGAHSVHAQPTFISDGIQGNQTNNALHIAAAPANVEGPYMELINNTSSDANRAGSIGYIAGYNSSNTDGISHTFYSRTSGGGWVSNLRILQSGKVQIGNYVAGGTNADYKLSVDGKLVARSVFVTAQNWADFVFEPSYKRLTLPALEQYLQLNKHLPSIPSAKEVETNGYSLGEMDSKMLQSMEELTLYVIDLNKRYEQLQAELHQLRAQVDASKR